MLHRERDCCSNDYLFKHSLKELREVLLKNSYPPKLIDSKIRIFLANDQKPERPERVHTLCLDFNAFSMESYVNSLLKKMQKLIPTFHVNVAYKTKTVSSLFSTNSKAPIPVQETSNVCYQFQCACSSTYIGHTSRTLTDRAREHQRQSQGKAIFWHIETCQEYQEALIRWQKNTVPDTSKKKNFQFLISHFKILEKSFRSKFQRERAEAFYIRVKRPDLNDQKDHELFKLF